MTEQKECTVCGQIKPFSEYYKDSRGKYGLFAKCKKCHNEKSRDWQQRNPERMRELQRQWKENNPEKAKEKEKRDRENSKEYRKEYMKKWRERNPNYSRKHKEENPEIYQRWYEKNKDKLRENRRVYTAEQRKKDPFFRLKENYRNRIYKAFINQGFSKDSKTQDMLGCDFKHLEKYIEDRMESGMTWDNYGEWHIDHIIPLSSALTEEDVLKLCHYTNLQPLWASENLSKRDKILYKNEEYENDNGN